MAVTRRNVLKSGTALAGGMAAAAAGAGACSELGAGVAPSPSGSGPSAFQNSSTVSISFGPGVFAAA